MTTATIVPTDGGAVAVERELAQAFAAEMALLPDGPRIARCLQCGTCTGSCPSAHVMDIPPREMVAHFRTGNLGAVLGSRSIWLCSSCYACTTRCPVGIKLTDIVYTFKRLALARGLQPRRLPVVALPDAFIGSVRRFGRNNEPWFMIRYFWLTGLWGLVRRAGSGLALLRKGRLPIVPVRIRGRDQVREILRRTAAPAPSAAPM